MTKEQRDAINARIQEWTEIANAAEADGFAVNAKLFRQKVAGMKAAVKEIEAITAK